MDAARAAVSKITGRTGHTTDVDEIVNPAVTSQTIKPHRHEETTQAIDREVHQDHYHTTVQPIQHREVIPEKHTHNLAPQIEKEYRHDNEDQTRRTVSAELGRFQNTSTIQQTTHSTQNAPTVTGEHVHHHVHETVQPIIHKETVQPEVVHTTIPIHEVHHASATHHGMSALPMKTLDEFTRAGGLVTGTKSHTHEEYDGAPRPYNEKLSTTIEKVLPGHHGSSTTGTHGTSSSGLTGTHGSNTLGQSGNYGSNTTGQTGALGAGTAGGLAGTHGSSGNYGTSTTGQNYGSNTTGTHGSGLTGGSSRPGGGLNRRRSSSLSSDEGRRRPDSGVDGMRNTGNTGTTGTTGTKKPSLMDKLNPRVDANGDGQPGFMK